MILVRLGLGLSLGLGLGLVLVRTTVLVSGGFSLTVLVAGLMGSLGRMAVTEPGAVRGGAEVLGVTRDC